MSDLKARKGDPLRAESWNRIVDRIESRSYGNPAGLSQLPGWKIEVANTSGRDYDIGEVFFVDDYDGPTSGEKYNIAGSVTLDVIQPLWHTKIAKPVVAAEPIPDGETGFAVFAGMCLLSVDPSSTGDYAMIDPATTYKSMLASGGFALVLKRIDTSIALAVLGHAQPLWRYKLTEASLAPEATTANLYTLDGTEYSTTTIELSDPLSIGDGDAIDYEGYCTQAGNEFHIAAGPC